MSYTASNQSSRASPNTGGNTPDSQAESNNKMTKSYLLESEAYLKTNCKSMANTAVPVDAPSSRMRHRAHHHNHNHHHHYHGHHHHHYSQQNSATDDLLRGINIWNHTVRDPIVSGLERGKPLTLHNVAAVTAAAANFPPIAYINGNSVRPIRCRHYSAQQTAPSMQAQTRHNTDGQVAMMNATSPLATNVPQLGDKSMIDDCNERRTDTENNTHRRIRRTGADNNRSLMDGSEPCKVPTAARTSGNGNSDSVTHSNQSTRAANQQYEQRSPLSTASNNDDDDDDDNTNNHSTDSGNGGNVARVPSTTSGHLSHPHNNNDIFNRSASQHRQTAASPARSSPRPAAAVAVDDNFGDENDSNVYSLCGSEDEKKVVEHLAKRIEGVLRSAKESRRLVCNELLVPQALTANIAQDVIKTAECEPCALRGCVLRICIEETQSSSSSTAATTNSTSSNSLSSSSSSTAGMNSSTTASSLFATGSGQMPQLVKDCGNVLSSSRLLGEIALDRSLVPTFEVFLVLKRARTNWLDSLESKLLGRERIVLSEIYLLHKKKLY